MDDYIKDLLNNTDGDAEKTAEPEAPAVPEAPAEPEVPAEPVQTAAPQYPNEPQYPNAPAQPNLQNQYYNQYNAPQRGTYYNPPVQNQYNNPFLQQNQYNEYRPPIEPPKPGVSQQPQGGASQQNQPAPRQPKKKGKGLVVIMIIAILCALIAVGGLWSSSKGGNSSNKDNSSSSSQSDSKSDNDSNSSDAEVEVKGSDEAAKTDSKGNLTVAGVVEKVKDSCVGITVYTEQSDYSYFYNYGQQNNGNGDSVASGEGSGVIMKEAGGKTYIMTCAHVIADGSSYKVTLDNDKEYDAQLVAYDSQTDIGVLSIDATGLKVAEFGDSKDIEVGEDCLAIGCPGGLTFKNSVTRGIVSALDVPVASQIGYSTECIQVDAAIHPGNSGGALFNMQGQVIGINSSKIASTDYEGMGFAVPSNTAVETANSLVKNGYVAGRARLGITYNTLNNYNSAQSILSALAQEGYKDALGTMVVQEIDDNSDLKGKLQQYDMIVAVNGKTLTSTDIMTSILSKSKPGDKVKLTVGRIEGDKIKTFEVECKLIESRQ